MTSTKEELEDNTIYMDCLDVPSHKATIHVFPHRFAGVWECETCETTDFCEHPETEIVKDFEVCIVCGVGVDYVFEEQI